MGMHRGRTSAAPAGGAAAERSAASAQAPEWAWADGQSARAGARAADLTRGALKAVAHGTHVLVPHRAGPATHKATEEVAVGAKAGHGRGADHAQGVGAGGQRREAGASQPVVQEGGRGGVRDPGTGGSGAAMDRYCSGTPRRTRRDPCAGRDLASGAGPAGPVLSRGRMKGGASDSGGEREPTALTARIAPHVDGEGRGNRLLILRGRASLSDGQAEEGDVVPKEDHELSEEGDVAVGGSQRLKLWAQPARGAGAMGARAPGLAGASRRDGGVERPWSATARAPLGGRGGTRAREETWPLGRG